jgi:hypothetical protein
MLTGVWSPPDPSGCAPRLLPQPRIVDRRRGAVSAPAGRPRRSDRPARRSVSSPPPARTRRSPAGRCSSPYVAARGNAPRAPRGSSLWLPEHPVTSCTRPGPPASSTKSKPGLPHAGICGSRGLRCPGHPTRRRLQSEFCVDPCVRGERAPATRASGRAPTRCRAAAVASRDAAPACWNRWISSFSGRRGE